MGLLEGNGYQLEPEAFEQLTKGIRAATSELKELGFDMEAQLGRGFDRLSLDSMECGDDGLAAALDSFCDRWGWGVRTLMQDANTFSKKLGLAAGNYYEQEQYVSDVMKQTVNASMGDPSLTAEQLHKRSWGTVLGNNPISQVANADFDPNSKESLESRQQMVEVATQAGQDVTSIPDRIALGDEEVTGVSTKFYAADESEGHGGNGK
ncbi:hypothetical protein AB0G35_16730 [Streptomyces sp. NPDC021749]|uniref:hypothetical protein n=1 Tax=Streptomyces sp. NPDC021749 TaxID=3154905 RepID=UPI0033EE4E92